MMDKNIQFTKIAKFKMDGKTFVRFNNFRYGDAYLKLNEAGKYLLPTTEEFAKIISIFYNDEPKDIFRISSDMKKNHKKFNFIPKLNHKGKAIVITSALALSLITGCGLQENSGTIACQNNTGYTSSSKVSHSNDDGDSISELLENATSTPIDPYEEANYNSEDNAQRPFDVTYEGDTYIKVNNSALFDDLFGKDEATLDDIYKAIDNNKSIPNEYKSFMKQYYTDLYEYYGGIELRVFEYNLKDVKFEQKPLEEIQWDTQLSSAYAYWDNKENKIVVSDNLDIENNAWDLVTLRHELGHLGNYFYIEDGEYAYKYQFKTTSTGGYVQEAMDCIFTTNPYLDYYESVGQDNTGYPLIQNELRVIIDCIDYNPKDSIDHNIYYLENQMNQVMGDELDSHVIMGIIDMQQTENQDQVIELDEQEYIDLYTYITKLYMTKYVNNSMSYSEIMDQKDTLKDRLLKAVQNPEYVYVDVIDEVFENYCLDNNITASLSK